MGDRLKTLLKRERMTVQDFADFLCCGWQTAWTITSGKRLLRADEIVMICNKFNVTADWLLGMSDVEVPNREAAMYRAIKELVQKEESV